MSSLVNCLSFLFCLGISTQNKKLVPNISIMFKNWCGKHLHTMKDIHATELWGMKKAPSDENSLTDMRWEESRSRANAFPSVQRGRSASGDVQHSTETQSPLSSGISFLHLISCLSPRQCSTMTEGHIKATHVIRDDRRPKSSWSIAPLKRSQDFPPFAIIGTQYRQHAGHHAWLLLANTKANVLGGSFTGNTGIHPFLPVIGKKVKVFLEYHISEGLARYGIWKESECPPLATRVILSKLLTHIKFQFSHL